MLAGLTVSCALGRPLDCDVSLGADDVARPPLRVIVARGARRWGVLTVAEAARATAMPPPPRRAHASELATATHTEARRPKVVSCIGPRRSTRFLSTRRPGSRRASTAMRMRGLEPPRARAHTDLNRARLPIPPHPRGATV